MAITLGHRWPMRSNLQRSHGLGAYFKSTRQQLSWKCDLNLLNMCFRLSIWPNGHRESQEYEFSKWIPWTSEATGLIVYLQIQLKSILGLNARCLFGPGSTWTSSPMLVPTPLILLGTSPPCIGGQIEHSYTRKRRLKRSKKAATKAAPTDKTPPPVNGNFKPL